MNVTIMPGAGMARYADEIRKYPMLSPEEERALAEAWRDRRDPAALQRLAGSHLRLVVKIARGFMGYGLPLEDLIAEGNLGLMQAIDKFEPDRGFRLATYALWWIRATIQEYILHSWSLVKMGTTAAQKKLFFKLRASKARLRALDSGDLAPEIVTAIATDLDVSEKDVIEMNRRLCGDRSLNTHLAEEGEAEWQDFLVDERPDQEEVLSAEQQTRARRRLLEAGLSTLNERERHIIKERRLRDNPPTLEELSHHYGVSRERIRQIEERAAQKLEKAIRGIAVNDAHAAILAA